MSTIENLNKVVVNKNYYVDLDLIEDIISKYSNGKIINKVENIIKYK
jgi:hypothetical protein